MAAVRRLKVNELFCSLQGEGTRVGRRCAFVRLTGCNLRCSYCDTAYAFYAGRWMSIPEILDALAAFDCRLVEVTGGEPLLQPGVHPLLDELLGRYETVLLETSGSLSIAGVDPRVVRIVDFKCPSSGESHRNDWSNVQQFTGRDEVKFVIANRDDYQWAAERIAEHDLTSRCEVVLSPVRAWVDERGRRHEPPAGLLAELAEWILADRLDVRLVPQLHKLVWPPEKRGV